MRRAATVVELDEARIAAAQRAIISDTVDLMSQAHNDADNSRRVIVSEGKDLRYVHAFKNWLVFDGRRWDRRQERPSNAARQAYDAAVCHAGGGMGEGSHLGRAPRYLDIFADWRAALPAGTLGEVYCARSSQRLARYSPIV